MPNKTSNTFKEWNQQGLFPGPDETEKEFIDRANFCLELDQNLSQQVGADLPFNIKDRASKNILQMSSPLTQKLFGITPEWVPLFFSNHQLSSWQGGCAWIFQLTEATPTAAFLQLRANFRANTSYLGLYNREELISHELSHVGRMMYHEPQFEEVLAYQTSSKSWRRWLGPIVQSPRESLIFVLLLGLIIIADAALISLGNSPLAHTWTMWLKLLPIALIGLALSRLGLRQWQFSRCLKKLENLYNDPEIAQHVIYRLRDNEIKEFGAASVQDIRTYMNAQQSFRWTFLKQIYPA